MENRILFCSHEQLIDESCGTAVHERLCPTGGRAEVCVD